MIKQPMLTTLALALLASNTAFAGEYNIYGKAEVQLAHTDKGIMRYTEKGTQVDSPFSRLGINGSHNLNETTQVIFKYEVQINGVEGDNGNEPLSARNTYIGLKSQYGSLLLGRNDTGFKRSEGKVDLFNETQADIGQVLAGQYRVGDSITYVSPNLKNWTVVLTVAPKDDAGSDKNGVAAVVGYGDRSLKSVPYYFALSYTDSLLDLSATRFSAAYRWDKLQLGAILQNSESLDGSKDGNGMVLSARYKLTDTWQPKVQYARDNSLLRHSEEVEQFTLGLDYVFDKQTTAYIMASQLELETQSDTSTAIGLKYLF